MALITFKELREIARLHYSTIPPNFETQIREFLASLDTNGDHKLSLHELLDSSFSDGIDKDFIKQIFYGLDEKRTGNLGIDACMAIYFLCTYSKRICRSCNRPIAQGLAYTCFKCHADGVVPKFQVCLSCFSLGSYQHPHASSDMLHDYALFEQLLHHKSSRSLHPDDSPAPVRIMESQQTMKQCVICGDFHESKATGFMLGYHVTQMRGSPDDFVCEWCFSYFCSNCGARFRDSTTRAEPGKWLQKFLCPPCSQVGANANGYTAIVKKFHADLSKSDVMKQCKTCAIKVRNQTLFWVVNGAGITLSAPSLPANPNPIPPPNPPNNKLRDHWEGKHPAPMAGHGVQLPGSGPMNFSPDKASWPANPSYKASEFRPGPRPSFAGPTSVKPKAPSISSKGKSSKGSRSSSSSSDDDDDSVKKKIKGGAAKLAASIGGMFKEMSIDPPPPPSGAPGPGPANWGGPAGQSVRGRGRGAGPTGPTSFPPSVMGGQPAPVMPGRTPGPAFDPTYLQPPQPILNFKPQPKGRSESSSSSDDGRIDGPGQSVRGRGRGWGRGAGPPSFAPSAMAGQPAPPMPRRTPGPAPDPTYLQPPQPILNFKPQPEGASESSSSSGHSRSSSDDDENVGRGRGRGPRRGRGQGRGRGRGGQNANNVADDPNASTPGGNNNDNPDDYDRGDPRDDDGRGPGFYTNSYDDGNGRDRNDNYNNDGNYNNDRGDPRDDDGRGPGFYTNSYDDGNGRDRNDNYNNDRNDNYAPMINLELNIETEHNYYEHEYYHYEDNDTYNYGGDNYGHYENEGHYGDGGDNYGHYENEDHYGDAGHNY